jgi:hypothetical protein
MIIQVDIDSTLYDADPLFAELAREAGIDYPEHAYRWMSYSDIKKLDGSPVTLQEMKSVFRKAHSAEYINKQVPYENAAAVLNYIKRVHDNVDIIYVSDRHQQSNGPLRQWLIEHNFIKFNDENVATTKDKRHWMRTNKPEVVIDDRVRTILVARYELNSKVIVPKHNHNINLFGEAEGIYVEDDWNHIGKRLDKLVSLYLK